MDEVIHENNRLEKLLEFKRKLVYRSMVANVTGRNPFQWNSALIIDKGAEDCTSGEDGARVCVEQGMPVVNSWGVLGKVADTDEHLAKVIMLTDPQFRVAALVQRTRESVLVTGSLQGNCRIRYVSENNDIQVGDKIVTSKLSSSFPENLYIGDVVEIHDKGGQNEYIVEPAVNFSQIEEVLIILTDSL